MPKIVSWSESVTGKLSQVVLAELQNMTVSTLIQGLRDSDGDTVICVLKELLGHGEIDKLREVGNDPEVKSLWINATVGICSPAMYNRFQLIRFFGE